METCGPTSHSSDVGIDFSDPVSAFGSNASLLKPEKIIFFSGEKRGLNCPTRMFLINRVQIQTSKSRNIKEMFIAAFFSVVFQPYLEKRLNISMSKLKYPQHSSYCARQILETQ